MKKAVLLSLLAVAGFAQDATQVVDDAPVVAPSTLNFPTSFELSGRLVVKTGTSSEPYMGKQISVT